MNCQKIECSDSNCISSEILEKQNNKEKFKKQKNLQTS